MDEDPDARTVVVHRGDHVVAVNLAAQATWVAVDIPAGADARVLAAWQPEATTVTPVADGTAQVTLPAESAAIVSLLPSG